MCEVRVAQHAAVFVLNTVNIKKQIDCAIVKSPLTHKHVEAVRDIQSNSRACVEHMLLHVASSVP